MAARSTRLQRGNKQLCIRREQEREEDGEGEGAEEDQKSPFPHEGMLAIHQEHTQKRMIVVHVVFVVRPHAPIGVWIPEDALRQEEANNGVLVLGIHTYDCMTYTILSDRVVHLSETSL